MAESFIPVWMSIGEAEEFRRFLQDEARADDGEFPDREYSLIDGALEEETPRTFDQMQAERRRPVAELWAALEAIQGDAYLWQCGDSPFESATKVIEHLRKTARSTLHKLGLDTGPAPLSTQQDQPEVAIEQGGTVPLDAIESAVWRGMRGDQPEPDHWPETLITIALAVHDEVTARLSTQQSTTGKEDCETCGGSGEVPTGDCKASMSGPTCRLALCPPCRHPETETCPDCHGSGKKRGEQ